MVYRDEVASLHQSLWTVSYASTEVVSTILENSSSISA